MHQIEYVNNQKTKNYFAYLKKAIIEDYANNEKATIEDKKEAIKQKYQPQIKRINDLRLEKGKIKLREDDKSFFYFSYVSFEDDNLVIYEDMQLKNDFFSNTVNIKTIPLDDEKAIKSALDAIEEAFKKI